MSSPERDPSLDLSPVALLLLTLLLTWCAATYLLWPGGVDHEIIGLVARGWFAGQRLYLDVWDIKGPASYIPFGLADQLGRGSWVSLRAIDLLLQLIVASLWYRRLADDLSARYRLLFVLVYLALWLRFDFAFTALPDELAGQGVAIAVLLLAAAPRVQASAKAAPIVGLSSTRELQLAELPVAEPRLTPLLAGLFVALALLVKPQFAVLALPVALAARRNGWSRSAVGWAAGGTVLGLLLAFLILQLRGELSYYREALQDFGAGVYAVRAEHGPLVALLESARNAIKVSVPLCLVVLVTMVSLGVAAFDRSSPIRRLAVAEWLLACLLCLFVQGKYFGYQLQIATLPVAIGSVLSLAAAAKAVRRWDGLPTGARSLLASAAACAMVIPLLLRPTALAWSGTRMLLGVTSRQEFLTHFVWTEDARSQQQSWDVAQFLKQRVPAGGRVVVWAGSPSGLYQSGFALATPFAICNPLLASETAPVVQRYRARWAASITATPRPAAVLVESPSSCGAVSASRFPALGVLDALLRDYRRAAQFDDIEVWLPRS